MDKQKVAKQLVKIAKELVAVDIPLPLDRIKKARGKYKVGKDITNELNNMINDVVDLQSKAEGDGASRSEITHYDAIYDALNICWEKVKKHISYV